MHFPRHRPGPPRWLKASQTPASIVFGFAKDRCTIFFLHYPLKIYKKLASFYWQCSTEALWGDSLLLTIEFPGIPGAYLIDLRMIWGDWVSLGATQWFWTQDWIANSVPWQSTKSKTKFYLNINKNLIWFHIVPKILYLRYFYLVIFVYTLFQIIYYLFKGNDFWYLPSFVILFCSHFIGDSF